MFSSIYIIFRWKNTAHSPLIPTDRTAAPGETERNFRNRSCILQRQGNCLISPEKKTLFRVTSGIQHSAPLAWANTGTVISHRSLQSTHNVHLESSGRGGKGNPADRGQWCPLRSAISSHGGRGSPSSSALTALPGELGASGGSCKPGLGSAWVQQQMCLGKHQTLPLP